MPFLQDLIFHSAENRDSQTFHRQDELLKKAMVYLNKQKNVAKKYYNRLNELWQVNEAFINHLLAESGNDARVKFTISTDIYNVKNHLKKGPVIVSTAPRYNGRTLGHVMLIVGYDEADNFIIDDPFGDFRDGYKYGHLDGGNDIHATIEEFKNILTNYRIYVL